MKQQVVRNRSFTKRLVAILVATTALVWGWAAAQTTIEYFSFTAGSDQIPALEELIAVFEAENPDIEIRYSTADFGSYFTKLQTDFAAGNAPDVFELNYENFVTFASRDTLLPIDDYVEASENIGVDTFYSAALNAFAYDGAQLGLPITFSTVMLFYNKDLFDAAGVEYPNDEWTWDDVMAAATAITDAPNRVWGISQPVQFHEFYKAAAQAGGGLTVTPTVQINTEENLAAAHYLVDKVQTYHVMPTDIEMSGVGDVDMFLNSQLGMIVTGIWMFNQITDEATFDWDVAVEPGGVQKATHFFSNAAVVANTSDNPDAAFRWVEFLAAHQAVVDKRIEISWELSALSLEQADLLSAYLEQPMPANREAVFESLEFAVNPPVIENQPQLQDIISQELEAARLGTKTVEQALSDAQSRIEVLMNE